MTEHKITPDLELKIEFIKFYYTLWNRITHPSPRVIIDTHTGTGIYEYTENNNSKKGYNSGILAILKTVMLSNKLTIILNEGSKQKYEKICEEIDKIETEGIPIFETNPKKTFQKNLINSRKKKIRKRIKRLFPEKIDENPPFGYIRVNRKTKAKIVCKNYNIEENIDQIFKSYFKDVTITKKDKTKKTFQVKGIFLVSSNDPKEWNLIDKIGEKAKDNGSIELIFVYSSPHIFINLKGYISNLKKYFDEVKILKSSQSQEEQFTCLFFCSNNPIGVSLADNRIKNMQEKIKYMDIREYL